MIATEMTEFKDFVGYYPFSDDTDERVLFRQIAFTIAQVTGLYNIMCCELTDDIQCGVSTYKFSSDLFDAGIFIDDILMVSVNGQSLVRTQDARSSNELAYSVDQDTNEITISPSPSKDCKDGLRVTVKLSVDMLKVCALPTSWVRKYAVHLMNYTVYKQEMLRRHEKNQKSFPQLALLHEEAVKFFEQNECDRFNELHMAYSVADDNGISWGGTC